MHVNVSGQGLRYEFWTFGRVVIHVDVLGATYNRQHKCNDDGGGGRGGMQESDKNQLLQHGGTQELISRIMENTFFNLISEVAHGEINLNVEPRTMVHVSENAK